MKSLLIILFSTLLALACSNTSTSTDNLTDTAASTTSDWQDRKSSYIKTSQDKLANIGQDIAKMEKTTLQGTEKARRDAREAVEDTKDLLKDVREDLSELRRTDAEDWEEDRTDFQTSMNELEEKHNKAKAYYKL